MFSFIVNHGIKLILFINVEVMSSNCLMCISTNRVYFLFAGMTDHEEESGEGEVNNSEVK